MSACTASTAASFPRQAEKSAFSAEQMGQSGFTISSLHRSVQIQTVSSVPLQAERSASSAEQTGQSGLTASFSKRISQMHSAGAFPDAPGTSPLSWE